VNKRSESELNELLRNHAVSGRNSRSLRAFGFEEWEARAQLYRGIMRARCYPFNLQGHPFHRMIIQASENTYSLVIQLIPCISLKINLIVGYSGHCAPPSVCAR
jgi:hypothetical protein